MPIKLLWSDAAVEAAGSAFDVLSKKVEAELTEIMAQADGWLLHVVSDREKALPLICEGSANADGWTCHVRTGEYVAMPSTMPGDAAGASGGKSLRYPVALNEPGNNTFSTAPYYTNG